MIVIADTSPVNYLVLIDEIGILPVLYGRIIIPAAVYHELNAASAPSKVRSWIAGRPDWLEIREVVGAVDLELIGALGKGESEAIQLAHEVSAKLLLIDETLGRSIAAQRGFRILGTIGVLISAKEKGLIDAEKAISRLEKTNFYISSELLELLRNA